MKRRKEQGADKPKRVEKPAKRSTKEADAPARSTPVQPRRYRDPVDDTLDDSFPASDPPSWAGR
ncbi:MAG TPA: hypothetical protein VFU06_13280 [Longimicrobiales bacterium]|nr:hypothetical protein [Longimicrobiales bacterium]